jgi:hypothetical protein
MEAPLGARLAIADDFPALTGAGDAKGVMHLFVGEWAGVWKGDHL